MVYRLLKDYKQFKIKHEFMINCYSKLIKRKMNIFDYILYILKRCFGEKSFKSDNKVINGGFGIGFY